MPSELSELQKSLAYKFKNESILLEAVTHKSYHYENPSVALSFNERLEFLGDSVLGLVIAEYLYKLPGGFTESSMAKMKSFVVKASAIAESARDIGLGGYLRIGKGEEDTGGRGKASLLADSMEAVIGAVFIDGGYEAASGLVMRLFKERLEGALESGDYEDYKSALQEKTQMQYGMLPEYKIVSEAGMEHEKVFTVEVYINGQPSGKGKGRSKKEAQSQAAKNALRGF